MLTQSSIYKEYLDLMDTEAWKEYIILKIYKLQQIFRPRIISDASTSEKLYKGRNKDELFTWRWWGSNPRRLRLLRLAIQRQRYIYTETDIYVYIYGRIKSSTVQNNIY